MLSFCQTLGVRYRDGHGVAKDLEKAYIHFDKASELGDVDSLFYMGLLLLQGDWFQPNCKVCVCELTRELPELDSVLVLEHFSSSIFPPDGIFPPNFS